MADIELVIKIPEEDFERCKKRFQMRIDVMGNAIANGTPLPKGHWIYDNEFSDWVDVTYKCSCCKRAIIVPYEVRNEVYKDYPYCHCGAKMAESEK